MMPSTEASREIVLGVLIELSDGCSPMSATGGWFSTLLVASRCRLSRSVVLERLTELERTGRVVRTKVHGDWTWRPTEATR